MLMPIMWKFQIIISQTILQPIVVELFIHMRKSPVDPYLHHHSMKIMQVTVVQFMQSL